MRKTIIYILSFSLLFIFGCSTKQKTLVSPKAQKGVIDVSSWNFEKNGSIELTGEWNFFWKKFVPPSDSVFYNKEATEYIVVGKVWNNEEVQPKTYPPFGYATYQLRVKTKNIDGLALKLNSMATAAKYYIDGDLVAKLGKIGYSQDEEVGEFHPQIVRIHPKKSDFTITIHMSNYNYYEGGMYQTLEIGLHEKLLVKRQGKMAIIFFLVGSILIMAFYHLGLFALRRSDFSSLFFALFALALAIRAPLNGQYFLTTFFELDWQVIKKVDFGGFYSAVGFFILFLHQLFPKEFPKWLSIPTASVSALATAFVLVTPYSVFGGTLPWYQFFTLFTGAWVTAGLVMALVRKRESALAFLIGFSVLFGTTINDVLHTNNVIFTAHLIPFGFFFFIFSQAFLLSARFSAAFYEQKRLTLELDQSNRELENRVKERTLSLQEANNTLSKLSIVADKTDNGVMIMNPNGDVEWVNEGFTRMCGFNLEDLYTEYGRNLKQISNYKLIDEWLYSCITEKKSIFYETHFIKKEGGIVHTQTNLTPVLNKNGDLTHIVAVDTDISNQKFAEAEIQQQKVEIEAQRDEVVAQRDYIANQNKRITDSLLYARNIQNAITTSSGYIQSIFNEAFILNKPKDIVSGDFVWACERENEIVVTVADCTGHGVPGAFMSSLGVTFLNQIINIGRVKTPGKALSELRKELKGVLDNKKADKVQSRDGIDMALCFINKETLELQFAGAYNPLWIIRDGELSVVKGNRMPVGAFPKPTGDFTTINIPLQRGDCLYMFSDGYIDQFYDGQTVKFNIGRFKQLLLDNYHEPMHIQHRILEKNFTNWKGSGTQLDDVMVLGMKI